MAHNGRFVDGDLAMRTKRSAVLLLAMLGMTFTVACSGEAWESQRFFQPIEEGSTLHGLRASTLEAAKEQLIREGFEVLELSHETPRNTMLREYASRLERPFHPVLLCRKRMSFSRRVVVVIESEDGVHVSGVARRLIYDITFP